MKPLPGEKNAAGRQRTAGDSKRDALEICLAWERAEGMAGRGDATEQQIRKVLSETLERIGAKPIEAPTVAEWLNHWLGMKEGIVAASTMSAYKQTVRDFLAFLGKRADAKLENITDEHISGFRDHIRAQGLAASTVRNIIKKLLNSPFNVAWRAGKIPLNPVSSVQIESKRDSRARRTPRGTFTAKQVRALVNAAADFPDWQGLILAAYYIGGRLQDMANLRREQVDLKAGVATYTQRKTGAEVICPVHSVLLEHLRGISATSPFFFPSLANKDEGGRNGLSRQFGEFVKAAGIDNPVVRERVEDSKRSRNVRALTFHSLRHSFNSELANAGVPIELRQLLTGHASEEQNKHYTHTEIKRLRDAVEKVPRV